MASLLISEYAGFASTAAASSGQQAPVGNAPNVAVALLQEPVEASQTVITLSGTSQQSAAFATNTRFIRVWTDAELVYYLVGSNPTATTATGPLERGFTTIPVVAGAKIAVRT